MAGMGGMGGEWAAWAAAWVAWRRDGGMGGALEGGMAARRQAVRGESGQPMLGRDLPSTARRRSTWQRSRTETGQGRAVDTERTIAGRRFRKWRSLGRSDFQISMATLRLRVLGQAYFRLLAEHPELSAIFALGNRSDLGQPERDRAHH